MHPKVIDKSLDLVLSVLNDVFLLEKRILQTQGADKLLRYTIRIREHFAEFGYVIEDPTGQTFNETRTDCEASIAGVSTENLIIKDVLKPIVRFRQNERTVLVQRAVVVVSSV
ncbi:hypothetical protein BH10ACI2_BH10ACI2_01630 [soil metagenome]